MQILIFGAPGVGKGTQAVELAKKFNLKHISTGDILRENIQNNTELGQQVKSIIEKGELVPDNLIGKIVKDALIKSEKKFILDGFPRTRPQVDILEQVFDELKISSPKIIILETDDDVIIKRLTNRRTCNKCGAIVNLLRLDKELTCPKCGEKNNYSQRDDDTEDVIKNRLKVYHKTTKPAVDYYRAKEGAMILDGTLEPLEILAIIESKL